MIGEAISHYRILSKLGAGGMGEVYLAQDTKLDRKVALKVLPSEVAANQERMERFVREAKSAAALNHPNIAHIYEISESEGTNFIAMEYVAGETLRLLLTHEKMEIKRAVEFAAQVASGLAAAHKEGIVHRDVKPENLMVARASQIKILDFGLAKLVEKQGASMASDLSTLAFPGAGIHAETKPGVILGTVAYMSPEQASGRALDHRTDIFSLGVVLYEMLTGKRPFEGKSAIDTLHEIINQEPPPAIELNTRLPAEIADILAKALAKDVDERYQHAGDFELDLRRLKRAIESNSLVSVKFKESQLAPQAVKPRAWRTTLMWVALSTLVILGVAVTAWVLGRRTAQPSRAIALENAIITPLTTDPGYEGEPTFSRDGQTIAYVSDRTGNFEIFLKQISGGRDINLTNNPGDDIQPAFSPDGTQIAFVSSRSGSSAILYSGTDAPLMGGGVWVMPLLGGSARQIAERGNFPSWSPDGHLHERSLVWRKDLSRRLIGRRAQRDSDQVQG